VARPLPQPVRPLHVVQPEPEPAVGANHDASHGPGTTLGPGPFALGPCALGPAAPGPFALGLFAPGPAALPGNPRSRCEPSCRLTVSPPPPVRRPRPGCPGTPCG